MKPRPEALSRRDHWVVDWPSIPHSDAEVFETTQRLLRQPMRQVTLDRLSGASVLSLERNYYVKTFAGRGSRLKDWLGISRYRREVRNLHYFAELGLGTPTVAAYGQEYRLGLLQRSVLVTAEVTDALDLAALIREQYLYAHGVTQARAILTQIGISTRALHASGFYHKDLKPRNILVRHNGAQPELFFFDCPSGHRPPKFMLHRGIVRDLAHLEDGLRGKVRRVDLLYMYRQYRGCQRLSPEDKALAREVLGYYAQRRMTRKRRRREREKLQQGTQ